MSIEEYYLSRQRQGDFGTVYVLKQLQEANSSGGGIALLGSVVPEVNRAFSRDYVIPQSMIAPRALVTRLAKDREKLGIKGDVTLRTTIAAGNEVVTFKRKHVFQIGVGPFPMVPFNAGLDIDYARMATLTVTYGEGTYYEYIPLGYLGQLYQSIGGEPTSDLGGVILRNQAFINQILLANKYSVTFESTEEFTTEFDAKIKAYNSIPDLKGTVKVSRGTTRTVKAEINRQEIYLIGIASMHWEDCDLT